jgi:hypothetical protein
MEETSHRTIESQPLRTARRRRRRNERLIVAGVLVAFAAALAIALVYAGLFTPQGLRHGQETERQHGAGERAGSTGQRAGGVGSTPSAPRADPLIDDDGTTLWASPTDGPPLDLSYLPPGPQIVLALRPAALAAHPEGEKVLAALGPIGESSIGRLEQQTGVPFDAIDRLVIGWRTTRDGAWDATLVATLVPAVAPDQLERMLASATRDEHRGKTFFVAGELAYYQPASVSDNVLVVAAPATIREIIELDGHAPPLRRELERLLEHTDASRHVTLVCAPNFLFSDGRGMFSGPLSRLRGPLFRFLGDGAHAAALSLDWHDGFFLELLAVPTLDVPPDKLADALAGRVDELPNRVEDYVLSLSPQPYGRRVVARFPEMVRKLAAYTRHGFERDHAVLRCYLPAVAGHNLLMGAELTLAESPGAPLATGEPASAGGLTAAAEYQSVRERLARRTSLRFARDTLEAALAMLADDVGVKIVIRGPDLQSEGITKNQSFGIDLADRPAGEILVEILRLANPDKMATGPADPRQKLVYVVPPAGADGSKVVIITTRAQAAARGDELPAVFAAGPR